MEYFKDIPGYEGIYQVSNCGRVLNKKEERFLLPHTHKYGYLTVCLCYKKKRRYAKIHRLVLLAFRGKSKLMVNHIDHTRDNNHISNLEYVTNLQNVQHCVRAGRNSKPPRKVGRVPDEVVRYIRTSKESFKLLMKKFNMGQTHVYRIRNRQAYAHVTDV